MRIIKTTFVIAISFFTIASVAQGQQGKKKPSRKSPMIQKQSVNSDSITDEELKKFALGMQKAQRIQMQTRAEVKKMVEDQGLTFKRFQKIMMSKRNKKMKDTLQVTDAEKAKIDSLRPKIQSRNKKARKKIFKAIESTGMSRKRFQQIGRALRKDKKLVKRFKKIRKKLKKQKMKNMMKKKMKQKMKNKQQDTSGNDGSSN